MKKRKGLRIPKKSMDFYRGLFIGITSIIFITFLSILSFKAVINKKIPQRKQISQKEQIPQKKIIPRQVITEKVRGKIAIIIDDNGYSSNACRYINSINRPIAIAILPSLPHSKTVAACAYARNKEIMLHLPLEPKVYTETYSSGYIITTDMSEKAMRSKIDEAISSIPHIDGINNHMGSKATEDSQTMQVVLTMLKEKNLFFVDSRVTTQSVAPSVAKKIGIPFSERDVFLDNNADRHYIENQFSELSRIAQKEGSAIGIGHDRALTWAVLKEQLPLLENRGFQIVTIKEIIQDQSRRNH